MPQQQAPQGVAQPVKKRGRFSNISSHHQQNLPTHQRNIPEGFVRDLLDEDDSEDDPDFLCDVDLSDDDDDAFDELPEPRFVDDSPQVPETNPHTPLRHPRELTGNNYTLRHQLPCQDPEFEVDSLDSTDDEDGDNSFREDPPQPYQTAHSHHNTEQPQFINFGDIELNSEDDENDPDFEAAVEHDELRPSAHLYDAEDEPAQSEARDDEYVQFLMSLLKDDENAPPHQAVVEEQALATSVDNRLTDAIVGFTGEDDDDFDYLRASAMIQDDPLEYRDDLPVSRKEVAQLLFQNNESNLRRQTRMLRTKRPTVQPMTRPHGEQTEGPLPMQPSPMQPLSVQPGLSTQAKVPHTDVAAPRGAIRPSINDCPLVVPRPQISPQQSSFMSVSPMQSSKFNEQLDIYMQILTHVHAVCKTKARSNAGTKGTGADMGDPDPQCDPVVASKKSEYLLNRMVQNRRVVDSYHRLMRSHISGMRDFSQGIVQHQNQPLLNYDTGRRSAYDKPVLGLIEPFLCECETASVESMPGSALKAFAPYERQDIQQALTLRVNPRQFTMSRAQEGWFTWTVADDNLLAMTIAKYGRECGDYVKDLLPHRVEEDCRVRVRYLASRRCQDNPVKRQVLHVSTPLNKDEIRLVEAGLQKYGGKIDDPNVWKQIQRHLLPTREWSHLHKLWLWRETRRKYKATYRAKLSKKKTLTQQTVVR